MKMMIPVLSILAMVVSCKKNQSLSQNKENFTFGQDDNLICEGFDSSEIDAQIQSLKKESSPSENQAALNLEETSVDDQIKALEAESAQNSIDKIDQKIRQKEAERDRLLKEKDEATKADNLELKGKLIKDLIATLSDIKSLQKQKAEAKCDDLVETTSTRRTRGRRSPTKSSDSSTSQTIDAPTPVSNSPTSNSPTTQTSARNSQAQQSFVLSCNTKLYVSKAELLSFSNFSYRLYCGENIQYVGEQSNVKFTAACEATYIKCLRLVPSKEQTYIKPRSTDYFASSSYWEIIDPQEKGVVLNQFEHRKVEEKLTGGPG